MTQFTQKAIIETFLRLLNTMPLNQITVQMIADECGISRNTFYYHFGDVYALLETIFQQMFEESLAESKKCNTRLEEIRVYLSLFLENRQAVYHIYDSMNHRLITKYIYDVTTDSISELVQNAIGSVPISEENLRLITFMYQSLFLGFIEEWLHRGLKGDPSAEIEKAERLFLEGVRLVLEKRNPENSLNSS